MVPPRKQPNNVPVACVSGRQHERTRAAPLTHVVDGDDSTYGRRVSWEVRTIAGGGGRGKMDANLRAHRWCSAAHCSRQHSRSPSASRSLQSPSQRRFRPVWGWCARAGLTIRSIDSGSHSLVITEEAEAHTSDDGDPSAPLSALRPMATFWLPVEGVGRLPKP